MGSVEVELPAFDQRAFLGHLSIEGSGATSRRELPSAQPAAATGEASSSGVSQDRYAGSLP